MDIRNKTINNGNVSAILYHVSQLYIYTFAVNILLAAGLFLVGMTLQFQCIISRMINIGHSNICFKTFLMKQHSLML